MSESRAKLEGIDGAGVAVLPSTLEMKEFGSEIALAGLKVGAEVLGASWRAMASASVPSMRTSGVGSGSLRGLVFCLHHRRQGP